MGSYLTNLCQIDATIMKAVGDLIAKCKFNIVKEKPEEDANGDREATSYSRMKFVSLDQVKCIDNIREAVIDTAIESKALESKLPMQKLMGFHDSRIVYRKHLLMLWDLLIYVSNLLESDQLTVDNWSNAEKTKHKEIFQMTNNLWMKVFFGLPNPHYLHYKDHGLLMMHRGICLSRYSAQGSEGMNYYVGQVRNSTIKSKLQHSTSENTQIITKWSLRLGLHCPSFRNELVELIGKQKEIYLAKGRERAIDIMIPQILKPIKIPLQTTTKQQQ